MMHTALSAASQTLREILRQALISDIPSFDSGGGGTMKVSLDTPPRVDEEKRKGIIVSILFSDEATRFEINTGGQ